MTIEDEDKIGFVITTAVKEDFVMLEFSDGPYTLNKAMVEHLGGKEEVLKYTEQAKHITADDFVKGFWNLVSADAVNKTVDFIVQQHLANPLHTLELNLDADVEFVNPFPPPLGF